LPVGVIVSPANDLRAVAEQDRANLIARSRQVRRRSQGRRLDERLQRQIRGAHDQAHPFQPFQGQIAS